MKWLVGLLLLNFGFLLNSNAVPPVLNYAGQVAVNGEAFDGNGLFKFALVNADGTTTYWSNDGTSVNGSEPQASISVSVNGGLYAVLLGNTAQQGMGAIHPAVFAQHTDAKLRVWFSDGVNGFQQLSPDRPFASVPYAFSAGTAQTAGSATIAPGSIDRSMLNWDIRSDLNRTISHNDLSPQIKADINATIGLDRLSSEVISKLEQNATITYGSVTASKMADGAVTASKIASNTITTNELSEQILKYLKPEITSQPQASTIYAGGDGSVSFSAEGKYLTYQWKKDGVDLTGETNATLNITDANATLHDGNYSVVVSNDFGSVESEKVEVKISDALLNGLVGWWKFDETSGTVAYDSSGNGYDGNLTNGPTWTDGKIGGALNFDGVDDYVDTREFQWGGEISITSWVKYKAFQQHSRIIDFGNGQNSNVIVANSYTSGNIYFEVLTNTSSKRLNVSDFWLLNVWIHFVATIDEHGVMKAYRNAILSGSKTDGLKPNSILRTKQYIGKSNWAADSYFKGLLDDLRIYDRALSAEEVQALYNLGQ